MNMFNKKPYKMDTIKGLLKDAEANGFIYVKSEIVAKQLKQRDPKINITYRKEDKIYIVSYF